MGIRGFIVMVLVVLFSPAMASAQLSFGPPSVVNTNAGSDSGNDYTPRLATDGLGTWVAVWSSFEDLGGSLGADSDILFARSTDDGDSWSAPAALNSNASVDSGADSAPQIATDGTGNWVVIWNSTDTLAGTISDDLDILFSRSTDNGQTWTPVAALNGNAATDSWGDENPSLALDSAGNWLAAWRSDDSFGGSLGTDADIVFSRSVDGGASWTYPAALNNNAASDGTATDTSVKVATDSSRDVGLPPGLPITPAMVPWARTLTSSSLAQSTTACRGAIPPYSIPMQRVIPEWTTSRK